MVFNPGSTKRQKEAARRDKQRKKDERRETRKREKETNPGSPGTPGEDPDIAGIVPGPAAHPGGLTDGRGTTAAAAPRRPWPGWRACPPGRPYALPR